MRSFEEMTTYEAFFARSSYKLTGDGDPDRVVGVMVPANFFPFLGVAPMLGRTFTDEETQLNGPGAAILSHRLWERRYSSDPEVIGRTVVVNDRVATIVGVMPPDFDFGTVFAPGIQVEINLPVIFDVVRKLGQHDGHRGTTQARYPARRRASRGQRFKSSVTSVSAPRSVTRTRS